MAMKRYCAVVSTNQCSEVTICVNERSSRKAYKAALDQLVSMGYTGVRFISCSEIEEADA